MRGSGSAPAATARRSAQAPAQKTACWPRSCPASGSGAASAPLTWTAWTSQPVATTRRRRARRRRRRARRPGSRRCRCPASAGPRSRVRGARARSMPGGVDPAQAGNPVGLAAALELVAAGRARRGRWRRSPCRSARVAIPRCSQYSYISRAPSTHRRAFSEPGDVVDAGVDHARVVAGLVGAELGLALEHADRRVRGRVRSARARPPGRRSRRRRREVAALGGRAKARPVRGRWTRLPRHRAGAAGRGGGGGVDEAGAVQAFVASAAELAGGGAQARGDLGGRRDGGRARRWRSPAPPWRPRAAWPSRCLRSRRACRSAAAELPVKVTW